MVNVRLDAARLLLAQSGELKAIAAKVGAPTVRLAAAFAAFEHHFGVSPKRFREANAITPGTLQT